jgi:hypothetical protein
MNVFQVTINLTDQAAADNLSGATTTFGTFFESLLSGIMLIAALMVFFFLIWGAIEWITAGGDQSKIQKGRDRIVQSIIGIIVLASTLALFGLVQSFLGLEILDFGSPRPTRGIPVCAPGATGAPGGGPCISPD